MLELPFPDIDPVLLRLGPVQIRWYGLMYFSSFVIGFFLLNRLRKRADVKLPLGEFILLLVAVYFGVMYGARLGYMVFYDLPNFLKDPSTLGEIWRGGMSFHGGFVGVVFAGVLYALATRRSFYQSADMVCAIAPIGLTLGRIGNFINGELYGRPTSLPWGMIFPGAGPAPRHPSQLYEALLEGLVLFVILGWLYRKGYRAGFVFWSFVGLYGVIRFLVEFVREPDSHIGFDFGFLTRGQVLTLPMLILGIPLMIAFAKRAEASLSATASD